MKRLHFFACVQWKEEQMAGVILLHLYESHYKVRNFIAALDKLTVI
jgi:hypothetical protein